MSVEGINQQTAMTCCSRFCNFFQNRYVAGSTLVISAAVSFIGTVVLVAVVANRLPTTQKSWVRNNESKVFIPSATAGALAMSLLLAKVLRLPMSWKPVVGIPVVVSAVIITAILKS